MLTEYVMKTEELLELSRGTIRFSIETEPIRFTDMSGSGTMTSISATLFLKYVALSLAEDPQRLIALKIKLGEYNRYAEDYREKLEVIRKIAPDEITKYLDEDGFIIGSKGTPGHGRRAIMEGAFE